MLYIQKQNAALSPECSTPGSCCMKTGMVALSSAMYLPFPPAQPPRLCGLHLIYAVYGIKRRHPLANMLSFRCCQAYAATASSVQPITAAVASIAKR